MARMPSGVYEKTPEHRAKLSAALKDRKLTPEHRAKISTATGKGKKSPSFIHGHRRNKQRTTTYSTWTNMLSHCRNPNSRNYKNWGGRGIKVCKRWLKFENFLEDMGKRPKGLIMDRKNNEGNYEPRNCRWVTPKLSAQNRRPRSG